MFKILILLLLTQQVNAQSVNITPSGHKYHLATCKMVENASEKISVTAAVAKGLKPCKICRPQVYKGYKFVHNDKLKGQSTTTQCRGITKAGNRCRHMTRIANGYCFQHSR
jgi:hypothetical protein